jgi:hypothetical protein
MRMGLIITPAMMVRVSPIAWKMGLFIVQNRNTCQRI